MAVSMLCAAAAMLGGCDAGIPGAIDKDAASAAPALGEARALGDAFAVSIPDTEIGGMISAACGEASCVAGFFQDGAYRLQRLTAQGERLGELITVPRTLLEPGRRARGMSVGMAGDGRFTTAFTYSDFIHYDLSLGWSGVFAEFPGQGESFVRSYDADGGAHGITRLLNNSYYSPSLAMAPDGRTAIAWLSDLTPNEFGYIPLELHVQRLHVRLYSADGVAQPDIVVADDFAASLARTRGPLDGQPVLAMNAAGDFVVVWRQQTEERSSVMARRYDAGGAAQTPVMELEGVDGWGYASANPDGGLTAVAAAMGDDGSFSVASSQEHYHTGPVQGEAPLPIIYTVRLQRYTPAGAPAGLLAAVAGDQPRVLRTPGGADVLAWAPPPEINSQSLNYSTLLLQYFDAAGAALTAPTPVLPLQRGVFRFAPDIALDGAGHVLVVWGESQYIDEVREWVLARGFDGPD